MRPPRASPQAKLGATNVIVFMFMTTKPGIEINARGSGSCFPFTTRNAGASLVNGHKPEPVLLIIADISGYTRYMTANAKTLAHSQTIITELVMAIVKQVELPLEVLWTLLRAESLDYQDPEIADAPWRF